MVDVTLLVVAACMAHPWPLPSYCTVPVSSKHSCPEPSRPSLQEEFNMFITCVVFEFEGIVNNTADLQSSAQPSPPPFPPTPTTASLLKITTL
jgi:hypothetical protein